MSVEFRYATADDYASISGFLDRYWAHDYIYVRKPELFDWTFGRRLWDRDGYSFALMLERGELAGILGAIPFVFNHFGRSSPALWLANFMVRQEYRKGPLALRLLNMFRRPPYRVNAVAGMSARAVSLYRSLRWTMLGAVPRYFAVFPSAVERAIHLLRLTHPEWGRDRAASVARHFVVNDLSTSPDEESEDIPSSWDAGGWSKIASQTIGAARDGDYLRWRYIEHPCFSYRLHAVAEPEGTGLAVWRFETIRAATGDGLEQVDCIGRLVEFLPVSRSNARRLLLRFCADAVEAGALGADYYGFHGQTGAWLREAGFKATTEHPDGQKIPARFQPLDGTNSSILTAVVMDADGPTGVTPESNFWYWTKSDGDQDRPN